MKLFPLSEIKKRRQQRQKDERAWLDSLLEILSSDPVLDSADDMPDDEPEPDLPVEPLIDPASPFGPEHHPDTPLDQPREAPPTPDHPEGD